MLRGRLRCACPGRMRAARRLQRHERPRPGIARHPVASRSRPKECRRHPHLRQRHPNDSRCRTNTAVQLPSAADIDPNHVYSLVELIDIAQSRNPATRVAWEQARQAAINVGIARAAYLPALTASVLAGYQHVVCSVPQQPCSARVHHLQRPGSLSRNSR